MLTFKSSSWKTLVVPSFIATMVMYGAIMIITAILDIMGNFDVGYSTASWILDITYYLITGAVMTPIAGKLSECSWPWYDYEDAMRELRNHLCMLSDNPPCHPSAVSSGVVPITNLSC